MTDPTFRFTAEVPLRWGDIDSWGILNNAVYLSLMEEARFQYFRRLDLLVDGQMPFVLAEASVRFLRPGRPGVRTTVGARVVRMGNKSFAMEYEVRGEEEVLATGTCVLVYASAPEVRTREIPAVTREAISTFEGIPPWGEPEAR